MTGNVFDRLLRDRHWLLFDKDRNVTGCHCGFPADIKEDGGHGDSVVRHLLSASEDRPLGDPSLACGRTLCALGHGHTGRCRA